MDYIVEIGRRQRKREAVHRTVLEAAQRLFKERGIAGTTVDEIAEAADVARQTVFNHFPYKEALALELGADNIQRVAERSHALLETGAPALDVLQQAALWILDGAIERGECAVIVAQELLHPDSERASRASERVPISDLFEAILVQAREEGSIRGELPLDIVANRIAAAVTCVVAQTMRNDVTRARRDLAVCFDVMVNGISERRT